MIKNLVLVGCGHMGFAMLQPWVLKHAAENIWVITPDAASLHGLQEKGVRHVAYPNTLPPDVKPDVIMFAVKPQILEDVIAEYTPYKESLFLSVAAGKKISVYESRLGAHARIVRVMPNLPAKVGEAATLLVANSQVTMVDIQHTEKLLGMLGTTSWLKDESLMDVATALSGCGPAYFYLLSDILGELGHDMGLPKDLASALAKQTMIGSAALWKQEQSPAHTMHQNIAVKGGLTEAALHELTQHDALKTLMRQALLAASERGKKLSG
ncbi:MAG: pyrroline-5-carboxylate reductase [Alphaproteobacteria bacterium]|nr:pyrroline-5-carboxylate reductase [Alphaproteobacteria bacterium]